MCKNLLLKLLPVLLLFFPCLGLAEGYGVIQHAELKKLVDTDLHLFLLVFLQFLDLFVANFRDLEILCNLRCKLPCWLEN